MIDDRERAAVVALVRAREPAARAAPPVPSDAQLIDEAGSARRALTALVTGHGPSERGSSRRQMRLLDPHAGHEPDVGDAEQLIAGATADLRRWSRAGIDVVTVLDEAYPFNLRAAHDRPALVFVRGTLRPDDVDAVAVVGSRRASRVGRDAAARLAAALGRAGITVASGLALGIDAAAHRAALRGTGRTLAVIGTGVDRVHPAEHAELQAAIASCGAVISRSWPSAGPTRTSFPLRNALMSGLTLGTVIVEATVTSGTRIQARQALRHGRPVFLHEAVVTQRWAQELADRPGVHVITSAADVLARLERLGSTRLLGDDGVDHPAGERRTAAERPPLPALTPPTD